VVDFQTVESVVVRAEIEPTTLVVWLLKVHQTVITLLAVPLDESHSFPYRLGLGQDLQNRKPEATGRDDIGVGRAGLALAVGQNETEVMLVVLDLCLQLSNPFSELVLLLVLALDGHVGDIDVPPVVATVLVHVASPDTVGSQPEL